MWTPTSNHLHKKRLKNKRRRGRKRRGKGSNNHLMTWMEMKRTVMTLK